MPMVACSLCGMPGMLGAAHSCPNGVWTPMLSENSEPGRCSCGTLILRGEVHACFYARVLTLLDRIAVALERGR